MAPLRLRMRHVVRSLAVGALMALATIMTTMTTGCDDQTTETFTAELGGEWFTLETAIDREKQGRGLGGRSEIPNDGGMIFVFDTDEHRSFWMKDCLIDMDILYVDRTGRIVSMYTMEAQPLRGDDESQAEYEERIRRDASYPSNGKARYVIELRAGRARELGLEAGQKLDLDLDRLKELAESDDGR